VFHDYMAIALKDRPVLTFPMPSGVTMASWDSGSGTVTDAFKPDQVPGASAPIGGVGVASAPRSPPAGPGSVHGGVDSSLGGLY
jgi:penicillin-binding protein 1A